MPLILAIEPDRKQAGRLTLLTRGLPGAELVLADSTEQALAALNGRVPNLILTSLLLSPKDEAGLRALNGSGVPVPTLMIPVFATAILAAAEPGGFLARLPWSRAGATVAPGTAGCDPAVFASQIWEYLQSSAPEDERDGGSAGRRGRGRHGQDEPRGVRLPLPDARARADSRTGPEQACPASRTDQSRPGMKSPSTTTTRRGD